MATAGNEKTKWGNIKVVVKEWKNEQNEASEKK